MSYFLKKKIKHKTKWFFSDIKKNASTNASLIQAFCAVVIVVLTLVSLNFNRNLIRQQKEEEYIKYRAYVAFEDIQLIPTAQADISQLNILLVNNGITPARNTSLSFTTIVDGVSREIYKDENLGYLNPNQRNIFMRDGIEIKKEVFIQFKQGKRNPNFLILKVKYQDYENNSHSFSAETQFSPQGQLGVTRAYEEY